MSTPTNNNFISTDSNFIGRGNASDPFILYPDFPGNNAVLQTGRQGEWTPATLGQTIKVYTCPSANDVDLLADFCARNWFTYKWLEQPNGVYVMTITIPYDELTNEDNTAAETIQWEILPKEISRNIFDAGIYYETSGGTLSTIRYTVPTVVQAAITTAVASGGSLTLAADKKYAPLAGIAEQFYALIKGGTTGVRASTHVAKRVAVYSVYNKNAYDNYPLIEAINENPTTPLIISTTDLVNLFQVKSTIVPHLIPSYSRFKTSVSQGDPVDLVARGGYSIGRPTTQFLTPSKIQITQLFEFDEWYDSGYATISNPSSGFPLIGNTPYPPTYTGR